jgi:uncharacterized SAM-binding protein YcdF (DUF218 family)
MLVLSTALMLLSSGSTLLAVLAHVMWVACRARSDMPSSHRILVLGARLSAAGQPTPTYRERLHRAFVLWSQAPSSHIIILGGRTEPSVQSEAAAGAALLYTYGVPPERILIEEQSRHTLDNLLLYRARLSAGAEGQPLLVTSRFHLARSSLLANGLGIAHVPCAAEPKCLWSLRHAVMMLYEAALIHWYITGRAFSLISGNKSMTARIT